MKNSAIAWLSVKKIDALEMEVDKLAVRIIALRAPMADDLREVIAALKIAGVVKRIGDYSKNIARRVGMIQGRDHFEPLTLIPAMGELAGEMVHDVLTAYSARDPSLALEVIATDAKVDAFYNSISAILSVTWLKILRQFQVRRRCCSLRVILNGLVTMRPMLLRWFIMPLRARIRLTRMAD